jgi:tetratricopeptide (TPR) repeat protein
MENSRSIYPAQKYYDSGIKLMKLDRFDDSIIAFEKALEIDPFFEDAFFTIIEVLMLKKDLISAEQKLLSSFYFENRYIRSLAALGNIKYIMKEYEAALELTNEVISISSSYPGIFTRRGMIWGYLGNYTEAQMDIETALFIDLKDGEALREKGLLCLKAGDEVEARHYLQEAVKNLDEIAQEVLYEIILPPIFSLNSKNIKIKAFQAILEFSAKNNLQIIVHDDTDLYNQVIGINYLKAVRNDPEYFCSHFGIKNKKYIDLIKSMHFTSIREIDYWIDKKMGYVLYSGVFKNPKNEKYNNLDGIVKKDNIKYLALYKQNKMDHDFMIYNAITGRRVKKNL